MVGMRVFGREMGFFNDLEKEVKLMVEVGFSV